VLLLRDVLERHPVAPFLSLHHPSRLFAPPVGIDHAAAWRQVRRRPGRSRLHHPS
jgi:hypothetical protein